MMAQFTTACGCSQMRSVPYPPQPIVVISLNTTYSVWFDEDNPPQFSPSTTRTFELRHNGGPNGISEYREKVR